MAQNELAGRFFRNATLHRFIDGFAHHRHAGSRHGLGKGRLQNRHLLNRHPISVHHRRKHLPGQSLAIGIVRFAALHQRAHDMLFRLDRTEEIQLRIPLRFVVNHGRMAGVGDEVRDVFTLWQFTAVRRGRVQTDDHRPGFQ